MILQSIDTAGLAAPDRLSLWHELAGRFIAPLTIEVPDRETFSARLMRAHLRDLDIISPCSSPARIVNGAGWDVGVLNLQLQLFGSCVTQTAGRTSRLDAGDFVLFDPSRPLELGFTEPTQTIVLRLPLSYVEARLPRLRHMIGVPVRGTGGAGALFSNFMRQAWLQLEAGEADWGEELADVVWPLLDLAYSPEAPPLAELGRREQLSRRVHAIIAENLTEPELDTRFIAARAGVSTRTIQLLFAELATTPREHIQRLRVERAASELARREATPSITDLAYEVGFNDLSSFSRAFRKRYDCSPSAYRLRQLG